MDTKNFKGLIGAYSEVYASEPSEQLDEGMTMKDFKQQRSRQKQKEKRAADKIAPNRRKDIHTDKYSPERAARHRANVDPDFEGNDERNYPGGKLKNPKKIRKAKALGELGEQVDLFDTVLEFLCVEGYAETLEEAEWIMANLIDEEAIAIILGDIDEATAMAKRGHDETAIRQKIAKSTGGGEAADRATKLENKPTYGDAKKAKQRQELARKQRGDFRKTTSSSPGLHGYAHKSDDPAVKAKQAARGAQRSALTPAEKKQLNREEFDTILSTEEQLNELSDRKMRDYLKKSQKSHEAINKKWDKGTATEKEKLKSIGHEIGQQRAIDKLEKRKLKKEDFEAWLDEAMSNYEKNRKRAAQRAAARNAARDAGKTGAVPGVGYVTPRREKETWTDEKGRTRHAKGL